MTKPDPIQAFHSGRRLQKLRELEGASIIDLAQALTIESTVIMQWELEGIPQEYIKKCSHYFEVSDSLFNVPINSQVALTQLIESSLFPQSTNQLPILLVANKASQSTSLDLSALGLSEIPAEILEYSWLKTLNLSDNQIKHIPSKLIVLQQLETLDLSNNLLPHIPALVSALNHLKTLNFQGNPLTLQPDLLALTPSLETYQTYLAGTDITIATFDRLTSENLRQFDNARHTIEQTQSVIIAKTDRAAHLTAQYQHLSSMLYITESDDPQQLAVSAKNLLKNNALPLFIQLTSSQSDAQYAAIDKQLQITLPPSQHSIKRVDSNNFAASFDDFQQRLGWQNSLPQVKFERLILENIGVYEHLDIAFNGNLTVLIGLNGAGKTTILKALALATLGPERAGVDASTAANLLRITGKQNNRPRWQQQGSIRLQASINGKLYENQIEINYDTNAEKVVIKGNHFDVLFNTDGHLINLMLSIGEQRNTSLKKPANSGLEQRPPKVKDLLPVLNSEEQACIAHFTSWLGNLAFNVSHGKPQQQQLIDISFAIFSALMQEPISFAGMTSVDPLELWVAHQDPEQIVPLRLASQGYQAVMGWVGLIIQRMFEAYENALQPLQQPAIIIIDEIDQLLHVKWQQKILNTLATVFFPNTQWIVTTHSPIVVTGLDQNQVIQLHQRDGQLVAEPNSVDLWLWQYGDIVSNLFDVLPEQPKEQEEKLIADIAAIKAVIKTTATVLTPVEHKQLNRLEQKLEQVQNSRAYIDKLYAQQLKLQHREQELTELIKQVSQQLPKA